ncbi:permease [Streptomyces sp. 5-10]|uniref:permease n=1 Tax=Streptomyces sp. 5-10 TaxID=878925 RepID=UPI00168B02F4|nr:permease [Streptomyces sp. 5-10]MBD3007262.1 permease [Streptomyces sp. 5-10]
MDSDVDIAPPHESGGSGPTLSRGPDGADGADESGGLRTAARVAVQALVAGAPVVLLGGVAIVLGPDITTALDDRAVAAWRTVFTAIVIQGVPFLLLGTVVSATISAFVPAWVFTRVLPRNPALAVPVAGAAGAVLPGCECASVPVAGSLMRRGVAPAAALAFLLSAPAINPIVLVATYVAFPGNPWMVAARLIASLLTSVAMGWLWIRAGREEWLRLPKGPVGHAPGASRAEEFRVSLQHDFLHAGGFLVVGAAAAATFNVAVPHSVLRLFSDSLWLSLPMLGLLAVVLAVCSEADAFVAASLTGFSPTARLAFMVVGPMVDLKLIALQSGTFGRAFAVRFSSATWLVAVACSALVGWWLL